MITLLLLLLLLLLLVIALPHCPGVTIRGILLFVEVRMVMPVTLVFERAVTPFLSVVVLMLGAAASFGRVEFVLRGGFLKVIGAQVLLGVIVTMEGLLFSEVIHANQRQ